MRDTLRFQRVAFFMALGAWTVNTFAQYGYMPGVPAANACTGVGSATCCSYMQNGLWNHFCTGGYWYGCIAGPAAPGYGCNGFSPWSPTQQDLCDCPQCWTERARNCNPHPDPTCTGNCQYVYMSGGWSQTGGTCACTCCPPTTPGIMVGQVGAGTCSSAQCPPPPPPPPPDPCANNGGDLDQDGCCDDVDYDNNDPNVCQPSPDPCVNNGGDADADGCCDDVDYDAADPNVCDPPPDRCENRGGDGDDDGCCSDEDVDDSDAQKCDCEGEGVCRWKVARISVKPHNRVWELVESTCSAPCNCCPPDIDPSTLEVRDEADGNCSRTCTNRCTARGGDDDMDFCCKDVDVNDSDPTQCGKVCGDSKERCRRMGPGEDGVLGNDDDEVEECDPDKPLEDGEEPCSDCEWIKNGDKDGDKCCDFQERDDEEAEDAKFGCECCTLKEEWHKHNGCIFDWHWKRVFGVGPRIVMTDQPADSAPPTKCKGKDKCKGHKYWEAEATPEGQIATEGALRWKVKENECDGDCSGCEPPIPPSWVGQPWVTACKEAGTSACQKTLDLPLGDPEEDYWEMTLPMYDITDKAINNITIPFPITIKGWKLWYVNINQGQNADDIFDPVDDFRKWFRGCMIWVALVMILNALFREVRV